MVIDAFNSLNFTYATLTHDNTVFSNYLSWMRDYKANKYIEGARSDFSLEELHKYIEEKNMSNQALLLGVFSLVEKKHIGNIKFEPIDEVEKLAWIGILIGESDYKGKGHSSEILVETMHRVNYIYGIQRFLLGVDQSNEFARRAYQKIGFSDCGIHEKGGLIMEKLLT